MRDQLVQELEVIGLCLTADSDNQEFGILTDNIVICFSSNAIQLISSLNLDDYTEVDYANPDCMDIVKSWFILHESPVKVTPSISYWNRICRVIRLGVTGLIRIWNKA